MIQEYEETNEYIQDSVTLPCPSCGSRLSYSAEHKKISCGHCGYLEEVNQANDKVVEQNLHEALAELQDFVPEETGKKVFDCQNCGAKFMVEQLKIKVSCGFCGSKNVNVEAFNHQYIQPIGIIPFYVSRDEAEDYFNKWIKRGLFHPRKLKNLAAVEDLHGVYIPFWTFDTHTQAQWSGEAGNYYYENVQTRINGRVQNQRVQKINWRYQSGSLNHFFDDILVVGSHGLQQKHIEKILPYRLDEVTNFDPRLMVGWEAEVYQIQLDQGYDIADKIIDYKLRNMCSAQLGGDTQRNLHVKSAKSNQTFKHIILPVWICSYVYQGKVFHFTINGQTGKVNGKKPISYVKIAFLILLFILFIVGVWYLRYSGILRN